MKKANMDTAVQAKNEVHSGVPFVKLEAGAKGKKKTTWLRTLPPRDDHPNDNFYMWIRSHFGVGGRAVRCLRQLDQFCPVCEFVKQLESEGAMEEANDMRGKYRAIMNVFELDDDGGIVDNEVKVFSCGTRTINDLTDEIEKNDNYDITDLENGYDVGITKKGVADKKGGGGKNPVSYEVDLNAYPTPVPQFEDGHELSDDDLHDLTAVYEVMEPQRLVGLLTGAGGTDGFTGDAIEPAAEKRALPAARRARDPEPEPEEGEFEEIEPEPEPAPVRRAAAPAAPARRAPARAAAPRAAAPAARATRAPKGEAADDAAAVRARLHAYAAAGDAAEAEEPEDE